MPLGPRRPRLTRSTPRPRTPTMRLSFTPMSRAQPLAQRTQADCTQRCGSSSRCSSIRSGHFPSPCVRGSRPPDVFDTVASLAEHNGLPIESNRKRGWAARFSSLRNWMPQPASGVALAPRVSVLGALTRPRSPISCKRDASCRDWGNLTRMSLCGSILVGDENAMAGQFLDHRLRPVKIGRQQIIGVRRQPLR